METAAILIIGNEILSGRTQDKNISFIGMRCSEIGIRLKEVRIIEDNELEIIENVKKLSEKFDHVFTTGGIGPTHDDITSEAIAKACKQKLELNKTAHKLLKEHFEETNSLIAAKILDNWDKELKNFKKVMPRDYKRVLLERAEKTKAKTVA